MSEYLRETEIAGRKTNGEWETLVRRGHLSPSLCLRFARRHGVIGPVEVDYLTTDLSCEGHIGI